MRQASKRAVLAVAAAACAALTVGCETMSAGIGTDEATEAATHARVLAELRETQRLGLITVGEESVPWFTEEQNQLIARAGDDATTGQAHARK